VVSGQEELESMYSLPAVKNGQDGEPNSTYVNSNMCKTAVYPSPPRLRVTQTVHGPQPEGNGGKDLTVHLGQDYQGL